MCLALSVTGLAVADQTTAPGAHAPRTASVSLSDAAFTSAQRRERRRHAPHGTTFVRRNNGHVRFHGTAKDPDRPHRQVKITLWHNGRRVRLVKTHWHKHHFHMGFHLARGNNRFVVRARNLAKGSGRSTLRTVHFHRGGWANHYGGTKRIAAQMLPQHGWGRSQMSPLIRLWNRESGWDTSAYNSSGAYGIPQALPGNKMSSAGPDWRHNAHTQIRWGLRYIANRYGSPSHAWAHSQATGWY